MTKYKWLTKEILQQDYDELRSLSAIGQKYNIPVGSVKSRAHSLEIAMDPPCGKSKYTVNEDFFSVDSEAAFYVAGFMAADGNITYGKQFKTGLLALGLSSIDKEHLVKIKEAMDFTGIISDYSYWNKCNNVMTNSSWLKIYCSKKLISDIGNRFNVLPQKTFTYTFPIDIINHEMVRHFLRGYFDGDGCFYQPKNMRRSISFELLGTQSFLETVKLILERECNLQSKTKISKTKNIHRLRYGGRDQLSKIANYLYGNSTIRLERKFDKIAHLIM